VIRLGAEVKRILGVLDRILADGRPYLAGDYSIGDIMHYPWLQAMLAMRIPMLTELPRVVQWAEQALQSSPCVPQELRHPRIAAGARG
jgi:glutathione S-transferase